MALRTPYAASGVSSTADIFRRAVSTLLNPEGGVGQPLTAWPTPLKVTALGSPNLSVNVAAGEAWIPGTLSAGIQGMYYVLNDATYNVSLTSPPAGAPYTAWSAPSSGNSQIISIVAAVFDTDYSQTMPDSHASPWAEWWVYPVYGTAASSPTAPSLPSNSILLAQFTVTHSTTSITSGMINDMRNQVGLANVPGSVPIGGEIDFRGPASNIPPGWLLEDGSVYSAAIYPLLAATLAIPGAVSAPYYYWDYQYYLQHGSYPAAGYFAVPNAAGANTIGAGAGYVTGVGALPTYTFAASGGEPTHTLSVSELAAHGHADSGHSHSDSGHSHSDSGHNHGNTSTTSSNHTHSFPSSDIVNIGSGSLGIGGGTNAAGYTGMTTGGQSLDHVHGTGTGYSGITSGNAALSTNSANNATTGSGSAHNNMAPYTVATKIIRAY